MNEIYEAYFTLLGKIGELLDRLSELARTKNVAAQRGDVLTVNECMKEEQSIGLTLRRMDQQRDKLLATLGLQGVPLSALPRRCPPAQRQAARATLECSLHNVEKLIEANTPGGELQPRKRGGVFTDFRT